MSKPKLDICLSPQLYNLHKLQNQIVVVIDVIRASTSICVALNNGVTAIAPIASINDAKAFKSKGYITAGERESKQLEGFDLGNSPFDFEHTKLQSHKLAMTTTNGTQAINVAKNSDEVIIGTFINAKAVLNYLLATDKNVLLLCAGWTNKVNVEDTLFAGMLAQELLQSNKYNFDSDSVNLAIELYNSASNKLLEFILKNSPRLAGKYDRLKADIDRCLEIDKINIVPILKNDHLVSNHAS